MGGLWADPDDRLLARSIFGTDDRERVCRMIEDWAARQGFSRGRVTAIELSVGAAVTIATNDRATMFVKVWPNMVDVRSLAAQMMVQRTMGARGFPAPAVLTGPVALGPGWAVGMAYDRSGVPTDATHPAIRRAMASGLARFVRDADCFRSLDGLPRRSLPDQDAIWPAPHSALFNFRATRNGAEWIDGIATDALTILRASESRLVIGHCDWSAKNMRMRRDRIAVVYDWDSVFLEQEAIVLGTAAAHFPTTWELDVPQTPSVAQVTAFVREYEAARDRAFTPAEIAAVEAGATYARAYKARCEHAIDPAAAHWADSSRESLKGHGPFRFRV